MFKNWIGVAARKHPRVHIREFDSHYQFWYFVELFKVTRMQNW